MIIDSFVLVVIGFWLKTLWMEATSLLSSLYQTADVTEQNFTHKYKHRPE